TTDGHVFAWRTGDDLVAGVVTRAPGSTTVALARTTGEVFEGADGIVTVRTSHGQEEQRFSVGPITDLVPFPNGRFVVTQNGDPLAKPLTLWDARHGTTVSTGTLCGIDTATKLTFSGD